MNLDFDRLSLDREGETTAQLNAVLNNLVDKSDDRDDDQA